MSNKYFILNSILIGVLINLILPLILKRFATTREIRSRGSTDRLTYQSKYAWTAISACSPAMPGCSPAMSGCSPSSSS